MKRFLVVDDSVVIRKVACRILESLDFLAQEAEDGRDGLARCEKEMPDAIMLDGAMPGMDGFEMLRALRRSPGGRGPKVLFCITENDVAQIARALHLGANEVMLKPFDRDIMVAKLGRLDLLPAESGAA